MLNKGKLEISIEQYWFVMLMIYIVKMALFSLGIESHSMAGMEAAYIILSWALGVTGTLLLLMSFFMILPSTLKKSAPIAVDAFISGLIIANRFHSDFFHSYIPADAFFTSGQGLSLYRALLSTFNPLDLLWGITIPMAVYVCASRNIHIKPLKAQKVCVVVGIIAGVSLLLLAITGTEVSPEKRSLSLKTKGLIPHYVEDIYRYTFGEKALLDAEEKRSAIEVWWRKNSHQSSLTINPAYYGKAEGKNVILLQVEALQHHVIHKKINGVEVTPQINRIIHESIYFPYCYDQVERATADGETLANLSLFPIPDRSIYEAFPDNDFNSLANTLKANGYRSATAFHGHEAEFYNREEAYPNHGFDQYISREHYREDEVHNELLGDKTFLKQTASYLELLEKPFYAFILTLTSHHPFNYLESGNPFEAGEYEGTIVGDYLQSIHYTDAAVGEFYDRLKRNGLLEDTLLVLYGDHVAFNYNERDQQALKRFLDADTQDPFQRIQQHFTPLIIRMPEQSITVEDHQLVGQIDIFPTIANLLGIDTKYLMGRDILNTEEDIIILRSRSYRKGDIIYYAPKQKAKHIKTGEIWDVDQNDETVKSVEETLIMNRLMYEINFWEWREGHGSF